MTRYRKKPVEIEAFQMTAERRHDNTDWPEWLNAAWQAGIAFPAKNVGIMTDAGTEVAVKSLEGIMLVNFGDWIIQGVRGEIYPCKPDIFEATYEAV